ncbi:E3 ubiquitin-protein ligase FANCL isoform X2 [Punica granatum]|uniref:E3 ubiquitin-protein ligase FANCL isoform X2 n=1 Tax=Punica granatum TaxID=22663 RepID=A0A6P8CTP3_PUNGR|nr:E3 ubiquitin-protein ligase FANCL isoform X2 [Punica granatum]
MECTERIRCRELGGSSSFHDKLYSEIEEVGWDHLVRLGDDVTFLSFRTLDKSGRVHVVEVRFDDALGCAPTISADIPYLPNIKWSANLRLKDVLVQFEKHLEKLQEFWSILDEIDRSLWIVGPKSPSRASGNRQVNLGNDCTLLVSISAHDPRSLPECRFLGPNSCISAMKLIWSRNSRKWTKGKSFADNLTCMLEFQLPKAPDIVQTNDEVECGICYAQYLPLGDELEAKRECGIDYRCDNANCSRGFHSICLVEWLRSISTTRQSFDVLFGNCPYCSEAIAVKLNNGKKYF